MNFYTNQNKPKAQPKLDSSKPGSDLIFFNYFLFLYLLTVLVSVTTWTIDDVINKTEDPTTRYINQEKIGEGAAGEVFLALDKKNNIEIAIKKMVFFSFLFNI